MTPVEAIHFERLQEKSRVELNRILEAAIAAFLTTPGRFERHHAKFARRVLG
jgi:hypothetical protein